MLRLWQRSLNRTLLAHVGPQAKKHNPKLLELQRTFKIWEDFITPEEENIILEEVEDSLRL